MTEHRTIAGTEASGSLPWSPKDGFMFSKEDPKSLSISGTVVRKDEVKGDYSWFLLTKDIEERGVTQPPVITPSGKVIQGQRRVVAAREAGLAEIPVIILPKEPSGMTAIAMSFRENYHREQISDWDRLDALNRLRTQWKFDKQKVADLLGYPSSTIQAWACIEAIRPRNQRKNPSLAEPRKEPLEPNGTLRPPLQVISIEKVAPSSLKPSPFRVGRFHFKERHWRGFKESVRMHGLGPPFPIVAPSGYVLDGWRGVVAAQELAFDEINVLRLNREPSDVEVTTMSLRLNHHRETLDSADLRNAVVRLRELYANDLQKVMDAIGCFETEVNAWLSMNAILKKVYSNPENASVRRQVPKEDPHYYTLAIPGSLYSFYRKHPFGSNIRDLVVRLLEDWASAQGWEG